MLRKKKHRNGQSFMSTPASRWWKLAVLLVLLSVVSPAVAMPTLAAYTDDTGELIMALDDSGNLYELTQEGWIPVGYPCPAEGPFSVELVKMESVEDSAFIFVFSSDGRLYQSDGAEWGCVLDPIEGSIPPVLPQLLKATESHLSVMQIDADGCLAFGRTDGEWQTLPDSIFSLPARDIDFHYDEQTQYLYPFVLGGDGQVRIYLDGEWALLANADPAVELTRFEAELNQNTGLVLVVAVDGSGNIYENLEPHELALTDHDPCPGEGPWELRLEYVNGSGFDLLCLDSTGALFLADDGGWERISDPFPLAE